jgi:hypothetical protein
LYQGAYAILLQYALFSSTDNLADSVVMAFFAVLLVILIPCIWLEYNAWKGERPEKESQAAAKRVEDVIAKGRGLPGDIPPKK